MLGILQPQRIENAGGRIRAAGYHLTKRLRGRRPEDGSQALLREHRQLFQGEPAHQQGLKADRQLAPQRGVDVRGTMQEMGAAKSPRKCEQRARRSVIAAPVLGSSRIENEVRVA